MGKRVIIILVLVLFKLCTYAQAQQHQCGTHLYFQQWVEQHPEVLQSYHGVEQMLLPLMHEVTPTFDRQTRSVVYKIPTVVHVLHKYGDEDISDAQVFDAIDILNKDFNKRNADTSAVVSAFANLIAKVNIEFVLARKDPQGNCTNGVDRIFTYKTDYGDDDAKLNQWDRTKYFNIWVVNDFTRTGVAGYAYFPSSFTGGFGSINSLYDGVIILHDYMGSIGTSTPSKSRVLTHECGHWLELPHPWGLNNPPAVACGDDNISDTPPTKGFTTCQLNASTCTAGVIENAQNFMDYSYCTMMFTPGQSAKMRGIISANVSSRGNLVSTATATSTGINQPPSDCPVKADFGPNRYFGCVGTSTIIFRNKSFGDTLATSSWTIADATFNPPGNSNVSATFNSPGWKDVSLTATSNAGSSTKTRTKLVYIADPSVTRTNGYFQSFDDATENNLWPTFNIYENDVRFTVEGNGYDGGNCLKLSTYDKRTQNIYDFVDTYKGDLDEVITPAMNLAGQTGINLGFYTSASKDLYSLYPVEDALKVYYSKNCGSSWTLLKTYDAATIINKSGHTTEYKPATKSDWVARTIPIPSAAQADGVYFKFAYTSSAAGNNFYLDNISFSKWPTALDNNILNTQLSVSPSVSNGVFTITVNNIDAEISICDLGGKIIETYNAAQVANMAGIISVDKHLQAGMYFISAVQNGVRLATQKLIVQ